MTATTTTTATTNRPTGERADLIETLRKHRFFLRYTARGLTDEQAGLRPTASELCIGGLIKHVTQMEELWTRFIVEGTDAAAPPEDYTAWIEAWQMLPDDTLEAILDRYAEVADRTDELVATLLSLDDGHPLPEAPWFEPGASWSARRALLHIVAETAQHAGHADIIRESIDGQKTMG
jgi:uncharacterized damage-inducible protein DinB